MRTDDTPVPNWVGLAVAVGMGVFVFLGLVVAVLVIIGLAAQTPPAAETVPPALNQSAPVARDPGDPWRSEPPRQVEPVRQAEPARPAGPTRRELLAQDAEKVRRLRDDASAALSAVEAKRRVVADQLVGMQRSRSEADENRRAADRAGQAAAAEGWRQWVVYWNEQTGIANGWLAHYDTEIRQLRDVLRDCERMLDSLSSM
jgi:hypothetical protein